MMMMITTNDGCDLHSELAEAARGHELCGCVSKHINVENI